MAGNYSAASLTSPTKAFDTVPRDLLFKKLQRHGVNGRFFNIIKSIYTNDQACVKTGSQCTKPFDINQGVRQGCVLSPLLFNIFLADLAKDLDEMDDKIEIGAHSLNSIFWADDILMFAKDKDTLQIMLSKLENYAKENKLEINTEKTQLGKFSAFTLEKFSPLYNFYKYCKGKN